MTADCKSEKMTTPSAFLRSKYLVQIMFSTVSFSSFQLEVTSMNKTKTKKISRKILPYICMPLNIGATDGSKFPLKKQIVTPFLIITYVVNLYLWNNLVNIKYLAAQQVTFRCFHKYCRTCNHSGFPLHIKALKSKCEKGLIWPC